jgi:hypothetical protein
VVYRVFANSSFVESATRIDIENDVGVVALRNDELVFDDALFTDVVWEDGGRLHRGRIAKYSAVNDHGDFLRIPPDAPFVGFFNPKGGVGAATVRLDATNLGPGASAPVLFDSATWLSKGEGFHYWFRSLVYFSVDWDRTQLIRLPKASVYAERNLYFFWDWEKDLGLKALTDLSQSARHRPDIIIGDRQLPPRN